MPMYIGPEITAPLASALAGLVGFLMLTWRRIVATWSRVLDRLLGRRRSENASR